jgi:glycosyltransferase involved in cell wall biosynthesis
VSSPFFSVIIPTYNRADVLPRAIESVLNQTFSDFEIIVVDDSTINLTAKVSKEENNRVFYFNRGKKLGVSNARNFGAKHARGKYLIFIDDDDHVTDNWLKDFASLAENNQYPDILFCGMEITDTVTKKKEVFYPGVSRDLWRFIFPGSWAITKTFFDHLGGYDERLLYGENTELFFRIRSAKPRQAMTDTVNFFYYPSDDGGSKNIMNKIESIKIVLEKHKDFFAENKRVKRLLLQVMGVSLLRLNEFKLARKYLLQALLLNPLELKTLLRLGLSFFPFISKRIYSTA